MQTQQICILLFHTKNSLRFCDFTSHQLHKALTSESTQVRCADEYGSPGAQGHGLGIQSCIRTWFLQRGVHKIFCSLTDCILCGSENDMHTQCLDPANFECLLCFGPRFVFYSNNSNRISSVRVLIYWIEVQHQGGCFKNCHLDAIFLCHALWTDRSPEMSLSSPTSSKPIENDHSLLLSILYSPP